MARSGARFLPLDEDERLQPGTMMFRMLAELRRGRWSASTRWASMSWRRSPSRRRGVAEGGLPRAALHVSRVPGTADGWFNVTRVEVDATDPFALSAAEAEGRRQAVTAARYIAAAVPGREAASLVAMAPQLGIRETRRIAGRYVLTADDLRRRADFADTIACRRLPDRHPPGPRRGPRVRGIRRGPFLPHPVPLAGARGARQRPRRRPRHLGDARGPRGHPGHADRDGDRPSRRHRGGHDRGRQYRRRPGWPTSCAPGSRRTGAFLGG